jgi:hypothetical protein
MSKDLIESIIAGNMIEANDMVEAKLAEIRERKMYEMKRMYGAQMNEVLGGMSPEELAAKKKAGYRKASDVYGDPYETKTKARKAPPKGKAPKSKKSKGIIQKVKKWVSNYKPNPPGTLVVKTAAGAARGAGKAIKSLASDLKDIGTSNLE